MDAYLDFEEQEKNITASRTIKEPTVRLKDLYMLLNDIVRSLKMDENKIIYMDQLEHVETII